MVEDERWWTPQEVAERLRVRVEAVYEWISSGELPATNVGSALRSQYRIAGSDLTALIGRRRTTGDTSR